MILKSVCHISGEKKHGWQNNLRECDYDDELVKIVTKLLSTRSLNGPSSTISILHFYFFKSMWVHAKVHTDAGIPLRC